MFVVCVKFFLRKWCLEIFSLFFWTLLIANSTQQLQDSLGQIQWFFRRKLYFAEI